MEQSIGVIIENFEDCVSKSRAYVFDTKGGIIGSSPKCVFCVQDSAGKVRDEHIKIAFEEGFFTISPIKDAEVFYGDSFSKMQSHYDMVINIGDTFRISNLYLRFVERVDESLLSGKEKLGEILKENVAEEIVLKPRGQVNLDFKENLPSLNVDSNPISMPKKAHLLEVLQTMLQELKQEQTAISLTSLQEQLEHSNLEHILSHIVLVDSTKLINALALQVILKELHSPLFEITQENTLLLFLENAINKSARGEKGDFESLVIKALEHYSKNPK